MKAELGVPVTVDVPGDGAIGPGNIRPSTDTIALAGVEGGKALVVPLDLGRIEAALVTKDGRRVPIVLDVAEPATLQKNPDLADLKPIFAARPSPASWLLGGLLLLLAALAALWLWSRRGRPAAPAAAQRPPLPPAEEALAALEALRAARGVALYAGLAEVLRRYAERRWDEPATSMTTAELTRFLRRRDAPAAEVKRLLDRADLVKFAKQPADDSWADGDLEAARRFVLDTAPPKEAAA